MPVPQLTLSNGTQIPAIGFGVGSSWRVKKRDLNLDSESVLPELVTAVENAINAGFTHLDSAEIYKTRKELRLAIANSRKGEDSSSSSSKVFVADKHYCGVPQMPAFTASPYESVLQSLKDFQTDSLDLYFLHSSKSTYPEGHKQLSNIEQWASLEKAYAEGKVKAIGVSNYSLESLKPLFEQATVKPHALQIEYHALAQDKVPGLVEFAQQNGIQIEAYAPLAPITLISEPNPLNEFLAQLAQKYQKSESQILLRWVSQKGVIPITTTSKQHRLQEALDIFSFELDDEDVAQISKLGKENAQIFFNW